jgi:hypothetical protein
MVPDMIGGDIEITRQQNRNFYLAEGFRRIAKESDLMNLALRYRIQAERDYRRALEEFLRLERLRPKLPNQTDLLNDPDGKEEIAQPWQLNPWIPKPPAQQTMPAAEPASSATQVEPVAVNPPSGNLPVAAWCGSFTTASANVATNFSLLPWSPRPNPKPARVRSKRNRPSHPARSASKCRSASPAASNPAASFSSPQPAPLLYVMYTQPKPPQ